MTVSKAAERITKFCLWASREKSVRAEHLALYAYLCSVAENIPGRVFTIEAREVMKASHVRRRKAYYQRRKVIHHVCQRIQCRLQESTLRLCTCIPKGN